MLMIQLKTFSQLFSTQQFNYLSLSLCLCLLSPLANSFEIDLSKLDDQTYYGFSLGQNKVDLDSDSFSANGQKIDVAFDDTDLLLSAFFVVPLVDQIGLDFSVAYLGNFSFSGEVSGNLNTGVFSGEQNYFGIGASAYYNKKFMDIDSRIHIGFMQLLQQTKGTLNLVGKDRQSLDDTEISGNLYLQLEASKKVYKEWAIGPSLSIINAGDRMINFAIKFRRETNN